MPTKISFKDYGLQWMLRTGAGYLAVLIAVAGCFLAGVTGYGLRISPVTLADCYLWGTKCSAPELEGALQMVLISGVLIFLAGLLARIATPMYGKAWQGIIWALGLICLLFGFYYEGLIWIFNYAFPPQ